jgi:Zn finger protein HypA/HybF involved in hydrogenase expression
MKCGDCGHVGDLHTFINPETHEQECPECGSTLVELLKQEGKQGGEAPPRKGKKAAA